MRSILLIAFSISLVGSVQSQDKKFIIETGLVYGIADYPLGVIGEVEYRPSWSVKVGRTIHINPSMNILWGARYSFIHNVSRSQGFDMTFGTVQIRTLQRQHYVSFPVQTQYQLDGFYIFAGPEVGFAAGSTLEIRSTRGSFNNQREETAFLDTGGSLSDINVMFSVGIGTDWSWGRQQMFSQIAFGQTLVSENTIPLSQRSGYTREFFFSTGVRL